MAMEMKRYDVRLPPERVEALKQLAKRLTVKWGGKPVLWTDLLRDGIDWVISMQGLPPPREVEWEPTE
jgi:hypothetical protein